MESYVCNSCNKTFHDHPDEVIICSICNKHICEECFMHRGDMYEDFCIKCLAKEVEDKQN